MDVTEEETINQKRHVIQLLTEKCHGIATQAETEYLQRKWTYDTCNNEPIKTAHDLTKEICDKLLEEPDSNENLISSLKETNSQLRSLISEKLAVLKRLQEK